MGKIKSEQITNFAVILIALSALFVSIWQGRLLQKHNKLSVKPYLTAELNQGDTTLTANLLNEGFGPAIIKKVNFSYQGQTYSSLEDLLKGSGEIENRLESWSLNEGTIISGNSSRLIVKLKGREVRGVEIEIEFISIYEEREKKLFFF